LNGGASLSLRSEKAVGSNEKLPRGDLSRPKSAGFPNAASKVKPAVFRAWVEPALNGLLSGPANTGAYTKTAKITDTNAARRDKTLRAGRAFFISHIFISFIIFFIAVPD
jgi:hypothetical protein